MKNIKRYFVHLEDIRRMVCMDRYYDKRSGDKFSIWADVIVYCLEEALVKLQCRLKSHAWASLDRGDGDSGGIGKFCMRCSETHWAQLY